MNTAAVDVLQSMMYQNSYLNPIIQIPAPTQARRWARTRRAGRQSWTRAV